MRVVILVLNNMIGINIFRRYNIFSVRMLFWKRRIENKMNIEDLIMKVRNKKKGRKLVIMNVLRKIEVIGCF